MPTEVGFWRFLSRQHGATSDNHSTSARTSKRIVVSITIDPSVRERGESTEWLQFFISDVAVQATDHERASDCRSSLRGTADIAAGRGRAPEVMDL